MWLGVKDETGEIIIGTPEGVVKARDFKRLGDATEQCSASAITEKKGTPWQPIPGRNDEQIPVRVRLPEEGREMLPNPSGIAEPRPEIRRRARISREDVRKHGYTANCPGCRAINRGETGSQNHTEECRKRIEAAIIREGGAKAKRMAEGNERFE